MNLLLFWHAGGVKSYYERYKNLAEEYEQVKVIIPQSWNEGGKLVNINELIQLGDNCEIIPVKTKFSFKQTTFLYDFQEVETHLKHFEPDVIHIHEEPWAFSTYQIIRECKKIFTKEYKIVIDSAVINMNRRFFPFSLIEKKTYSAAELIFARNTEVVEILKKRGYKGPIRLLGNGVDTKIFKRKDSFTTKKAIVFIGRLTECKGVFLLIEAFKKIIEENHFADTTLNFIGSGDAQDSLKDLAKKYKLENKIKFIDRVDSEKVVDYITDSRVLVLPSISTQLWKEQFGRVLIESLVVGRPVIGSTCGEIPNVINNEKYVFTENNLDELVEKIKFVLNPQNEEVITKDIEIMRKDVIEKYDWSNLSKYHITQIRDLA